MRIIPPFTYMLVLLAVIGAASALNISGEVDFVPSNANTTYRHYGESTGLNNITVDTSTFAFSHSSKATPVTFRAIDHGSDYIYFNFDDTDKKLYVNLTAAKQLRITGLQTLSNSTTGYYQIYKDGTLIDYRQTTGIKTMNTIGSYIIEAASILSTLGSYSLEYSSEVFETEAMVWYLNISKTIAQDFYSVKLWDEEGNVYNTTFIDYGDVRRFRVAFGVPLQTELVDNKEYYWNLTSYSGVSLTTSNMSVNATNVEITYNEAGVVDEDHAFYITIYDEDAPLTPITNLDALLEEDATFVFDYWYEGEVFGGGKYHDEESFRVTTNTDTYTYGFETGNGTNGTDHDNVNYNLEASFVLPTDKSLNLPIIYSTTSCNENNTECNTTQTSNNTYVDGTFTQKWYSFYNNMNNKSIRIIKDDTDYKPLLLTLYNQNNNLPLESYYVYLDRFYPEEFATITWLTVQSAKTDLAGKAVFFVKEGIVDYRFNIYNTDYEQIKTTESMTFYCTTDICSLSLYIDPATANGGDRPRIIGQSTYNNVSNIIEVRWHAQPSVTSEVTTVISKRTSTGALTLCEFEYNAVSGVDYCDMGSHKGIVDVTITSLYDDEYNIDYYESYDVSVHHLYNVLEFEEAAFWAFMIILVIATAAVFSPVGAIVATVFGVFFVNIFGLFGLVGSVIVILVGTLAVIISFKVRN